MSPAHRRRLLRRGLRVAAGIVFAVGAGVALLFGGSGIRGFARLLAVFLITAGSLELAAWLLRTRSPRKTGHPNR